MPAEHDGLADPRPTMIESRATAGSPGTRYIAQRLGAFAREFARDVSPSGLAGGALLVVLGAASEGIGLILLVPLIALLGDSSSSVGWVGTGVQRLFSSLGLPLSLPVLLLTFVAVMLARTVLVAQRDIELARLRVAFADSLRRSVYEAVAGARWSFLARQRLSDIFETLTSHCEGVGVAAFSFLRLPAIGLVAAIQLALAFSLSPWLTIAVIAWGAVLLAILHRRIGRQYAEGQQLFEASRASFAEISDFLQALKLAKACGAEPRHLAAFGVAIARQSRQSVAFDRGGARMRMTMQIAAAVSLGAFVFAADRFAHLDTASVLVMIVVFARLSPLVSDLQQGWESVVRSLPVFDGIIALRERCAAAAEDHRDAPGRMAAKREIRFAHVGFRHDKTTGPSTIEALDLVIPAGSTVAIVGRTGAGKSTLADLLLGLVTPDIGTVEIDGAPLTGAILGPWRRSVGYVPQENFLFNDTIRANLLWACPEATQADIERALAIAAADEFVANLPLGLDTVIGERGIRISGGERQRIGLARALLGRPTLLLLDEATSALDYQTERGVQAAIERLHGSMTIAIIAHRLSTIRGADRIFVLERGRLVQQGSWDALTRDRGGHFAELLGETGSDFGSNDG
ncbi:MAG TPA: ABC transporter ATP-binding protein [Stellaceae bacterium]|jgi:ATP-binding cassette subfamily C protein